MRRTTSILLSVIILSLLAVPDAYAKRRENDEDHYGRARYDDRWHGDRRGQGHVRHDDRRWHGKHYNYRPHSWQTVTVYSQPEYIGSYQEIRCVDSYNPLGTLLGVGIGGLAGSTIGSGRGRTAAIASGAVIGGLIGNNVTRQRCSTQVFGDVPVGRPVSWQAGPREAYAVVPVRDYRDDGQYCREYQSYAMVGGNRHQTYGTACLQPDGSWQIVDG